MNNKSKTNKKNVDHDLLVRMDERQKQILDELKEIKNRELNFVVNDEDFKGMAIKVDALWDMRNKMLGYSAAAGAIGAIILQVIFKYWKP